MPVSSSNDLSLFKQQIVRVFHPDGTTFIDVWRDAPLLAGFKESIDSATTPLRVTLPRSFDNFDEAGITGNRGSIGLGNVVQYWLYGPGLAANGLLRFQGVIDRYEPQIAEDGQETLTVTLTPQSAIIGDNGITSIQQFGTPGSSGTYADPITMFTFFFHNANLAIRSQSYVYPLTLDPTNPTTSGVTSQYSFGQQSILSIFNTILQLLPVNWFWRVNANNTVTLNVAPATAQHQFIIGRHITAPTYSKDTTQLKNFIQTLGATMNISLTTALVSGTPTTSLVVTKIPVALGAGQSLIINNSTTGSTSQTVTTSGAVATGATTIPVTSFTPNASYPAQTPIGIPISSVKVGTDIADFGPRFYQYVDSRITDAATAAALATYFLATMDLITYRFKLRIVDYRGDNQTGLGYDIETIKVGDTAQIINPTGAGQSVVPLWDVAEWDIDKWDGSPGEALNQIVIITALTYGYDYCDLEMAAFAPALNRELIALANRFLLLSTASF